MTDINDLVQELWSTSNDGAVGASFFAMRNFGRLFESVFILFPLLRLPLTWLRKIYRSLHSRIIITSRTSSKLNSVPNLRNFLMGIERYLINYSLNPKIWVTCSGSYLV